MSIPKIEPCWSCGAQPISMTRSTQLDGAWFTWTRLECCTAGSWSIHEHAVVDTWNRVQTGLEIQRTLERLDIPVQPFLDLRDRFDSYVRGAE